MTGRDYTPAVIRTRAAALERIRDAAVTGNREATTTLANVIAADAWDGNRYALAGEAVVEVVRRGYDTRFSLAYAAAGKSCDVDTPERLALHLIATGDALPERIPGGM